MPAYYSQSHFMSVGPHVHSALSDGQLEADGWGSYSVHTGSLPAPNTSCWSNSSRGRCQFLGIWQVAVSNLRVANSFQVGLWNPTTMPVREPCSLHPVCRNKRNQVEANQFSWLVVLVKFKLASKENSLWENDRERKRLVLRSLLCWCTRMMSAFSNDSSSGCWATQDRTHCICVKSVHGQEKCLAAKKVTQLFCWNA